MRSELVHGRRLLEEDTLGWSWLRNLVKRMEREKVDYAVLLAKLVAVNWLRAQSPNRKC